MRRKKREEEHENLERWLITYADLITLLLAFFIMMYVFSKQDAQKYDEVVGHLKTIFTGGSGVHGQGKEGGLPFELPMRIAGARNEVQDKLENEIKSMKGDESVKKDVSVFSDERGVVVRILDKACFEEGKADLQERSKSALSRIAAVIKETKNQIRIEGHTDNVPISNYEFKSNWELSARRATEVVKYFVERFAFPPNRISAAGYAEYRPVTSNDTAEHRALNRRIEIIILKSNQKDLISEAIKQ